MGRAGAGGYATVQHAYDTRLKRDVAIKCIKITPSDIERSRISIHDAQAINASRPLSDLKGANRLPESQRRSPLVDSWDMGDADEPQAGFVPLTAKISEPSFLSSREKAAERRAKRHGFLKGEPPLPSSNSSYQAEPLDSISMDLSDFEEYSNFKKPAKAQMRRTPKDGESLTIGLSEFAGRIPGKISGAGEVDISSIDNAINVDVKRSSGVNPIDADKDDQAKPEARTSPQRRHGSPLERDRQKSLADDSQQRKPSVDLSKLDHIPGLEEARTAAHLNDANIVTVYDCVVEDDTAYVIMEYVEGKTLAKIMREIGNDITLDMIASVFTSVSHALEVAHKAGVLHLDVKPENVIINSDGIVKVTDFGLSTLMDASGQGVTGGGTIGYMPLEQMRQQRLDVRTDEWALASLTYEMLSGKNPFKARNLREAEAAIEGAELVIPSLCWESIDESVDDIMFDALSPEMNGRYPDIATFSEKLTPILGDAKDGAKQLAEVVKGPEALPGRHDDEKAKEKRPPKSYVPFIDKLGMKGSSIVMRVFASLGTAMLAVISLMNFRYAFVQDAQLTTQVGSDGAAGQAFQSGADTMFGLFSVMPVAAWVILAALVIFAFIRPRWAYPANVIVLFATLAYNQAWLPGFLLLAGAGAWWWFFGRTNDMMCTLVLLQPLFGSVGFAAVVPVLAGALLDVRDALATTGMAVLSAILFASFGSDDVMNWDVFSNFIVAVNPSIAGASIANGFIETLASLQNWCVIASWIAAAVLYSLLCRKGTRVFDVLASITSAVLIVVGVLIAPVATGDFATLTPLTISGAATAALLGVVFALLNIPDRVRLAPGEW